MIRNTQKINEAVELDPSSIDELVPKLKQMQLDMKALEDKKVKSKSLRAQLAEATEKVEEVFATVVKAPCMILIPIFEALPSATDLKKDEKLVQFWEKVTCHLETADNFIAEKLTAFFDEMAQPESTLVWRSRRKLFADAIRFLRRSVSFFSWMCVHKFRSDDVGGTDEHFIEWDKLAAEGAAVFVTDLKCDQASWEAFDGSALALFRDWQKARHTSESRQAFAALDRFVVDHSDAMEDIPAVSSFRNTLALLKKMSPSDKVALTSIEVFYEKCCEMNKQALYLRLSLVVCRVTRVCCRLVVCRVTRVCCALFIFVNLRPANFMMMEICQRRYLKPASAINFDNACSPVLRP